MSAMPYVLESNPFLYVSWMIWNGRPWQTTLILRDIYPTLEYTRYIPNAYFWHSASLNGLDVRLAKIQRCVLRNSSPTRNRLYDTYPYIRLTTALKKFGNVCTVWSLRSFDLGAPGDLWFICVLATPLQSMRSSWHTDARESGKKRDFGGTDLHLWHKEFKWHFYKL